MGIAKVLQSLGLKKQAMDTSVPVPSEAAAPGGVDVVPGEHGALVEQKDQLETQMKDLEQQIAAVDQQMATIPSTPQPTQEESTMDPINTALPKEKPAVAPVETPAAAAPLAPAASVETDKKHEDKETKAEEKKEEAKKEAAFTIRFAQGKTFNDSYFVAEEKGEFRAVKASRIIPADVQEKILRTIAATGKPPEDVVTPTEIIDQMTGQGVNSLETFDTAAAALETSASRMTRSAAQMAWNESEVKTEKGDPKRPLSAVQQSEYDAGKKMHPVPSGTSSKVRNYYGRLPGSAGGEPTVAINPQSSASVKDKIDFMRRALEEMKGKVDAAEGKAKSAEDKIGAMEKEKGDNESSGLIESIVKDLIAKKLLDEKGEQGAVAALAKIDRKSLPQVAALLKLLGKSEGSAMGDGMPGAKPAIGMDAKPSPFGGKPAAPANPFGAEQHPKASMRPLPPTFLNENEPDMSNSSAFLAKFWDAK